MAGDAVTGFVGGVIEGVIGVIDGIGEKMKVIDIKGTRSTIKFVLEGKGLIQGAGELEMNGFFVYKDTLRFVSENNRKLTDEEIEKLIESVEILVIHSNFEVTFSD
ncbi:MAG: hypothetical protein GX284_12955 [Clostridiales bacterium]|nr:hypothetical protein [Clostridiales bacterium]